MTPFVFLVFVALLISSGIAIDLYLYNRGVFRGGRFGRLRRLQPAVVRTMSNEARVGGQSYVGFDSIDQTSRIARTIFFILLSILLGVIFLGTAALSVLVH